ncbi:MAG: flavodoxin domain-containing protein [Anaerolineales bacterium]|nr:flavodoxin domain-containing protein [Anaerolineales bacterium]
MKKSVLVAYATKYGATAEIAGKIGQVLGNAGLEAEVLPVKQVKSLTSYRAVILGSAVFVGMWRREAVRFLKSNLHLLKDKSVWLFSSGPTGQGDPVELLEGWRYPKALQPVIDDLQPQAIAVFHGNVDVSKLNPLHKWMIGKVAAPVGDFRDWDMITGWAEEIVKTLKV